MVSEGIAGYFETVRLDEGRASLDIGVPREGRLPSSCRTGSCRSPAVRVRATRCEDEQFYATTWALFTFLLEEHPKELMHYIDALVATPLTEQAPEWATVVPSLPPETVDHELATWIHYGRIRVLKYTIKLRGWPQTERPITEADVLAAKGTVRYLTAPEGSAAAEIDQSLALDPTNVLANLIRVAGDKSVSPELGHSLTSAHPDDWRAWYLAWRAAKTFAESHEAREKTCSLLAAHPVGVPIDECSKPAPTEDTRFAVFKAAMPQFNDCLHHSKYKELAASFSIDVDLDDAGAVTGVRVQVGSDATNTCIEDVLKRLAWPARHAGTFHTSAKGKGP